LLIDAIKETIALRTSAFDTAVDPVPTLYATDAAASTVGKLTTAL
jgi:hypothetical protein